MLFKIDENLPIDLSEMLNEAGHDAMTVYEQNLHGKPDKTISDICQNEERAIITFDVGFCDVRTYPPEKYVGIIVLRLKSQDIENVVVTFKKVIAFLETEPLLGKLWIVDENKILIRN